MNVRCHSIFHLRNISPKPRGSSVSTIKAFRCIQLTVGIRHYVISLLAFCFTFSVNSLFTVFSKIFFFLDSEAGFHDSAHAGTTCVCHHVPPSQVFSSFKETVLIFIGSVSFYVRMSTGLRVLQFSLSAQSS